MPSPPLLKHCEPQPSNDKLARSTSLVMSISILTMACRVDCLWCRLHHVFISFALLLNNFSQSNLPKNVTCSIHSIPFLGNGACVADSLWLQINLWIIYVGLLVHTWGSVLNMCSWWRMEMVSAATQWQLLIQNTFMSSLRNTGFLRYVKINFPAIYSSCLLTYSFLGLQTW